MELTLKDVEKIYGCVYDFGVFEVKENNICQYCLIGMNRTYIRVDEETIKKFNWLPHKYSSTRVKNHGCRCDKPMKCDFYWKDIQLL